MPYKKELERLNEYQKTAVLDANKACVVNANVGSGKTTVLISKILYLHEAKKVRYEDMVVLTFTNKAADEIKERLIAADENVSPDQLVWFGTFHGVCLNLLKQTLPVESLGYTRDFCVMTPEEELEMAEQLISEHKFRIKYKNRLKKRLEQAMQVRDEEKKISRYQDDIFPLVEKLRVTKVLQNKMTYQDLIDRTLELLPQNQSFAPKWMIVDEVQDSDERQLDLIDQLMGEKTRLFAVGDPNQVIYSWRGSALNVFYTLKSRYQAVELSLPINYRSSGSILEAARFFLQNGGALEGVKENGNKIVVKNHYNPFNEADYLAGKIKALHEGGVAYGEIAIFYRLQSQAKTLEDVFNREEIPYEVSLKRSIQDIPVLNWFMKVLRFSVNSADRAAAIAALTNKEYGIGCREKEVDTHLLEDTKGLAASMRQFQEAVEQGLTFSELYQYFNLDQYLRPNSSAYADDKAAIMRLLAAMEEKIRPDQIREFLNESTLYGLDIFEQRIDESSDAVKLMTLHASKGLEFSYVFIIGVNYGLIPMQSRGMEGDEEERRLFFVGITRAKEYLELSYYTSPDQYRVMPGPSRYLSMIPARLVEDTSFGKPAEMDVNERLQEIKKQILASRNEMKYLFPEVDKERKKVSENSESAVKDEKTESAETQRKVRHEKYGNGVVVREDEDNLEVEFEDYGKKEFLKLFCDLEFIEE